MRQGDLELADRPESARINAEGPEVFGLGGTPTLNCVGDGSSTAEYFHEGAKGCQERLARVAHCQFLQRPNRIAGSLS